MFILPSFSVLCWDSDSNCSMPWTWHPRRQKYPILQSELADIRVSIEMMRSKILTQSPTLISCQTMVLGVRGSLIYNYLPIHCLIFIETQIEPSLERNCYRFLLGLYLNSLKYHKLFSIAYLY